MPTHSNDALKFSPIHASVAQDAGGYGSQSNFTNVFLRNSAVRSIQVSVVLVYVGASLLEPARDAVFGAAQRPGQMQV